MQFSNDSCKFVTPKSVVLYCSGSGSGGVSEPELSLTLLASGGQEGL